MGEGALRAIEVGPRKTFLRCILREKTVTFLPQSPCLKRENDKYVVMCDDVRGGVTEKG